MQVEIGGIQVGTGFAPQMLADIDVYFKADEKAAFGLVDEIARSGCRFLKGAILSRPELCLPSDDTVSYFDVATGKPVQERYADVIARHLVPLDALARILARGRKQGLLPVLSVYDDEGIAFALAQGAVALKIPSSNIVHAPLIRAAVQTGLPILIDTGRSTLAEIDRAVGWARDMGAEGRLIVEHSPPGPPAGVDRSHLRMLPFLSMRYQCPVGLSDHAIGLGMLPLAVALGASILEKGFVMNDASSDIDVAHAMPQRDLEKAVSISREAWLALGQAPRPESDLPARSIDRMGFVARRALQPGDRIEPATVRFAFPPLGIPVEHWDSLQGQLLQSAVVEGGPITWNVLGRSAPIARS